LAAEEAAAEDQRAAAASVQASSATLIATEKAATQADLAKAAADNLSEAVTAWKAEHDADMLMECVETLVEEVVAELIAVEASTELEAATEATAAAAAAADKAAADKASAEKAAEQDTVTKEVSKWFQKLAEHAAKEKAAVVEKGAQLVADAAAERARREAVKEAAEKEAAEKAAAEKAAATTRAVDAVVAQIIERATQLARKAWEEKARMAAEAEEAKRKAAAEEKRVAAEAEAAKRKAVEHEEKQKAAAEEAAKRKEQEEETARKSAAEEEVGKTVAEELVRVVVDRVVARVAAEAEAAARKAAEEEEACDTVGEELRKRRWMRSAQRRKPAVAEAVAVERRTHGGVVDVPRAQLPRVPIRVGVCIDAAVVCTFVEAAYPSSYIVPWDELPWDVASALTAKRHATTPGERNLVQLEIALDSEDNEGLFDQVKKSDLGNRSGVLDEIDRWVDRLRDRKADPGVSIQVCGLVNIGVASGQDWPLD
jgi:hypothetical protein